MAKRKPRIGIALEAGSACGWAHIGILQALAKPECLVEVEAVAVAD